MFILRRLTSDYITCNEVLGKEYSLLIKGIHSRFEETLELQKSSIFSPEKVVGFIIYEKGSNITPLYMNSKYYVMTENGATFEKISFNHLT